MDIYLYASVNTRAQQADRQVLMISKYSHIHQIHTEYIGRRCSPSHKWKNNTFSSCPAINIIKNELVCTLYNNNNRHRHHHLFSIIRNYGWERSTRYTNTIKRQMRWESTVRQSDGRNRQRYGHTAQLNLNTNSRFFPLHHSSSDPIILIIEIYYICLLVVRVHVCAQCTLLFLLDSLATSLRHTHAHPMRARCVCVCSNKCEVCTQFIEWTLNTIACEYYWKRRTFF